MKRAQQNPSTRARTPKLKTAGATTSLIPKRYKPPSKLPPREEAEEGVVEQRRPGRYSRARGIAVKKLESQVETSADYGDDTKKPKGRSR